MRQTPTAPHRRQYSRPRTNTRGLAHPCKPERNDTNACPSRPRTRRRPATRAQTARVCRPEAPMRGSVTPAAGSMLLHRHGQDFRSDTLQGVFGHGERSEASRSGRVAHGDQRATKRVVARDSSPLRGSGWRWWRALDDVLIHGIRRRAYRRPERQAKVLYQSGSWWKRYMSRDASDSRARTSSGMGRNTAALSGRWWKRRK